MKHKMLGTLTLQKDTKWHVSLYKGKIEELFPNQDEAVKFIESELVGIMDAYDFEVCYRVENEILHRRSYILIERDNNKKLIHTSLTRYEYAKTHFFFYSKDKRRKIIDYKNPDFNQLTRHAISSRSMTHNIFFALMSLCTIFMAVLLGLFVTAMENELVKAATAMPNVGSHDYNGAMLGMIVAMFVLVLSLTSIYAARQFKYKSLVKTNSVWHESYSNVDWRKFYTFVKKTRPVVTILTIALFAITLTFGILFSQSTMFDAISLHSAKVIDNMFAIYIATLILLASFGYISTYYIIRFRISLYHIAPVLLTEEGEVTYRNWLKGLEVSKEEEQKAFHPVEEHLIYPNAEIINENPKFAKLEDQQIKQLRKDVKNYQKLIIKDKFGKHPVDPVILTEAKAKYAAW